MDNQLAANQITPERFAIKNLIVDNEELQCSMKNNELKDRYEIDYFNRKNRYNKEKKTIHDNWAKCLKT